MFTIDSLIVTTEGTLIYSVVYQFVGYQFVENWSGYQFVGYQFVGYQFVGCQFVGYQFLVINNPPTHEFKVRKTLRGVNFFAKLTL